MRLFRGGRPLRGPGRDVAEDPWREKLAKGQTEAAWDLFIERYRGLVVATIRRLVRNEEDVLDAFGDVCLALSADDLERLRRYEVRPSGASFSSWLVTVVRNLTIDAIRRRDGRQPRPPSSLTPLQRHVYEAVFVDGRTHAEAYEMARARGLTEFSFARFLRDVSATYRELHRARTMLDRRANDPPESLSGNEQAEDVDPLADADVGGHLGTALAELPADERLAVQLFVVDEMPAADVARILGWPSAKTVYNRVYRSLSALRSALQQNGLRRDDLG